MHILQCYTDCTIGYYTLSYYLLEYQADRYLSSAGKLTACKLLDIISLLSVKTNEPLHKETLFSYTSTSNHVVLLIIDTSRIIVGMNPYYFYNTFLVLSYSLHTVSKVDVFYKGQPSILC